MSKMRQSCAFITSNSKITVYGCDRVEKYTDSEISLQLIDGRLEISRRFLTLFTFVCGEISVAGEIERINFDIKKGDKSEKC